MKIVWKAKKKKCPTKFGELKVGFLPDVFGKNCNWKMDYCRGCDFVFFLKFATKVHLGIDVHTDGFAEIVVYALGHTDFKLSLIQAWVDESLRPLAAKVS